MRISISITDTTHSKHTSMGYADVEMINIEHTTWHWLAEGQRHDMWHWSCHTHTGIIEQHLVKKQRRLEESTLQVSSLSVQHMSTQLIHTFPCLSLTLTLVTCNCVCVSSLCICTSTVPSVMEGQGTTPEEQKNFCLYKQLLNQPLPSCGVFPTDF